jgi:hypothetical protein
MMSYAPTSWCPSLLKSLCDARNGDVAWEALASTSALRQLGWAYDARAHTLVKIPAAAGGTKAGATQRSAAAAAGGGGGVKRVPNGAVDMKGDMEDVVSQDLVFFGDLHALIGKFTAIPQRIYTSTTKTSVERSWRVLLLCSESDL